MLKTEKLYLQSLCFAEPTLLAMQVKEETKLVCKPDGYYGPLTDTELAVSLRTSCKNQLSVHLRGLIGIDEIKSPPFATLSR